MIITQLSGGLGNQLFQYGAARSLSLHHNTELKIDASNYNNGSIRNFELNYFNIRFCMISANEADAFGSSWILRALEKLANPYRKIKTYSEPHFHFDVNFFDAPNPCRLKGYWQSEKYFTPYGNAVRQDFTIKPIYIQHLQDKAKELKEGNSISIHIRRGDYLQNSTMKLHGILPREYYSRSINYLKKLIPNIRIYVFSDDPNWVISNLRPKTNYEIISGKLTKTNIEDLFLMSQCAHNVIANSSFSWWAAWLNRNPNKIVIAPQRWFNQASHRTVDLIPDTWIRL